MSWWKRSSKRLQHDRTSQTLRKSAPEHLEPRCLMAADAAPIHLGLVYIEADEGADTSPDRFILSFNGGAPDTELREVVIDLDKDRDGLSAGDLIFDTQLGGRGKEGAFPFTMKSFQASGTNASWQADVDDGGTRLVLRLAGFRAGDVLEFTIDVDEIVRFSPDLVTFNQKLDVIASGQEFEDSILEAHFKAPHYYDIEVRGNSAPRFLNDFGDPQKNLGLKLPPDLVLGPDGRPAADSPPSRNAAAVSSFQQSPLPIEISGTVWVDDNLNLKRDGNEGTLPGVQIALWKLNTQTGQYVDTGLRQTTDSQGKYRFGANLLLNPGTYRLVQAQPSGFFSVGAVPGEIAGIRTGEVADPNTLTNVNFELGDTVGVNYDFAEARPAALSGFVYRDDNNNGLRESAEPGIGNVSIRLVPTNTIASQATLTTVTDANGYYQFSNLAPGTYWVEEIQPNGYVDGLDTAGRVNGQVVGVAENDRITQIKLDGHQQGVDYNFGELLLGSLSGTVFLEEPGSDCDGIFNGNDTPLAGVTISLRNATGQVVAQTTTNAQGIYTFNDLLPGTYQIQEVTPDGLLEGMAMVGSIDGLRIGEINGGSQINNILLNAGGKGVRYDFCEAAPASISGYVYHDASNEGRRDPGEPGIPNTTIRLVNDRGSTVAETKTDAQGKYVFNGILPGVYDLVEVQPDGYLDGIDRSGTVFGVSRGGAINPGDRIGNIVLKQGDVGIDFDFGELLPGSLSGRIHADLDGDCLHDPNEQLLAGVKVTLLDSTGKEIATTLTDGQGKYQFVGLIPGSYTVVETQPEGYFDGGAKAGTTGGDTSIPNQIRNVAIGSGIDSLENNFCEKPPADLSGWVFVDVDHDCLRDPEEQTLSNVRIDLLNGTGQIIATTTTDSAGRYRFSNLIAGNYTVIQHQPDGYFDGNAIAGSTGGDTSTPNQIRNIQLAYGVTSVDNNFCEKLPAELSGWVFLDQDLDRMRDLDERGLANVQVDLINAAGQIVASTTTDTVGRYRFSNLLAGQYAVVEHQPLGFLQGGQKAGSHGGDDSLTDQIRAIAIAWGDKLIDYNFAEIEPASLAGLVFNDLDRDCVHDPNEAGIAGVRVDLLNRNGELVATQFTDSEGKYRFDNLAPGEYQVIEHQPLDYFQGGASVGTGGGRIVSPDAIADILIRPGANLVEYNFCEQQGGSISGQVWSETDLNGIRNPNDQALAGVLIELLDSSGQSIRSTRTNTSGQYRFDDLEPGAYTLRETQPFGLFHGGQRAGSHGGNTRTDDLIQNVVVPPATHLTEYNFFEVPPAVISGYVFQDGPPLSSTDNLRPESLRQFRDGVRSSDDAPLNQVTLELRSLTGETISASRALPGTYATSIIQVTTDANGFYQFTGLRPGTYHVYQVQPEGFTDGLDTAGSTGGYAINAADQPDLETQIIIQTLAATAATNPGTDAILRIALAAGGVSQNNNFSEIIIQPLPPPPFPPIQELSETPINPLLDIPGKAPLLADPLPFGVRQEPFYAYVDRSVTWHLSVINAGYPRGMNFAKDAPASNIHAAAMPLDVNEWLRDPKDRGRWKMIRANGELFEQSLELKLGDQNAIPVTGDFDGDGRSEIGVFIAGNWYIDLNGNGRWDSEDLWVMLGTEYDQPIVGDWDGDGKDDVGIFGPEWSRDSEAILNDPGLPATENVRRQRPKNPPPTSPEATDGGRLLRHTPKGELRADLIDHVFRYGTAADIPVAGDWNGDGIDTVGVFRGGRWILDTDGDGRLTARDEIYEFGKPGDLPIVGDWDGDGIDDIGVRREGIWIIDSNGDRHLSQEDKIISQPKSGAHDEQPISGDWDGDGRDEVGTFESTEPSRKAA